MPNHSDRVRTAPLPAGYQFGDAAAIYCFASSCQAEIVGDVVWLGESYDGIQHEWPFHPRCAEGPWPLYETRRSYTRGPWRAPHLNAADRLARHAGWNVIEGDHFDSDEERHSVIAGVES